LCNCHCGKCHSRWCLSVRDSDFVLSEQVFEFVSKRTGTFGGDLDLGFGSVSVEFGDSSEDFKGEFSGISFEKTWLLISSDVEISQLFLDSLLVIGSDEMCALLFRRNVIFHSRCF
jgi:hypothetical protein